MIYSTFNARTFFASGICTLLAFAAPMASAQIKPDERKATPAKKTVTAAPMKATKMTGDAIANPRPKTQLNPQLSASRLNQPMGWSVVGAANFAEVAGAPSKAVIAPNGNIYVALVSTYPGDAIITTKQSVQLFEFSGGTWDRVGAPIMSMARHDLAVDAKSVPYLAYQTDIMAAQASSIAVKKLVGGIWERVGTTPMKGGVRIGSEVHLDIDLTTNDAYLAYGNGNFEVHPQNNKITVRKFDMRSNWLPVGPEELSPSGAWSMDIEANDGEVYVSYSDQAKSGKVTVRRLAPSGWTAVGSNDASAASARALMTLDAAGKPVIAYNDTNRRVVLRQLVGNNWTTVNDPSAADTPKDLSGLGADLSGNPVVTTSFNNFPYGEFTKGYKFSGQNWSAIGEPVPGKSHLMMSGNTPYLSLTYYSEVPDIDLATFNMNQNNLTFDDTRYASVKKFNYGTSKLVRPALQVK